MAFYIEKALFINRAPFEHLELDFKTKGINVLSAINGKGKTTILSHIVDAFHQLAKKGFEQSYEGIREKLYRISSPHFDMGKQSFSMALLKFNNEGNSIDYVDIRGILSKEQYNEYLVKTEGIPYDDIKKELDKSGFCRLISSGIDNKVSKSIFSSNVLTYFPSYRYEQPGYLNDPFKVKLNFDTSPKFNGYLSNPIEVITCLQDIANWLMDVVLDEKMSANDIKANSLDIQINSLIKQILGTKLSNAINLGLGPRNMGATRVGVLDKDSKTIYPSIFNMSSGEVALLSIFGNILMQTDRIELDANATGIVLIDEVDKHLHIKLQKEVLPSLFKLFPNIQFIVSSHSPFLNMGLADELMERSQIFDLDNNGIVCEPTNNRLYQEVYEMMTKENQRFADKYNELKNKVKIINKPIVITEGKTDWKHFKAALRFFQENHEFEDLDVELLEYDFDFGDSKLHNLLNQYKTFPPKYKIVGIFDCDEANGRIISATDGIKEYGHNVWGMSIPIPNFRSYNTSGISIEFLYKDEDLKRRDEHGRRIYTTSEFDENGRLKTEHRIGVKNNHDVKNYVLPEKEKIQADEVIDIEGNSLALSKEQFATNILDRNGDFANMDFEAFKPVFERLRDIINNTNIS